MKNPDRFHSGDTPAEVINNGGGNMRKGAKSFPAKVDPWRSWKGGTEPKKDPEPKTAMK